MRFIVFVKASKESEAGQMPSEQELKEMNRFNEELVKAGVMLAGEGLHPTSKGVRIKYSGPSGRTVVDGPFSETKEVVAGFWILQCKSREECVEWLKRAPFQEGEIEIRQVFEEEEFAYAPEAMEQEKKLREQIQRQQQTK